MSNPLKILMLEDSAADAEIVQQLLKKKKPHYEFSLAMDKETYVLALDEFHPDVILAGNSLQQFSAAEALEISRRRMEHTPFIMVTDTESEEFDTDIINLGADDYVLKDRLTRLPVAIEAALRQQKAEKEKLAAIEKLNLNEENYRNLVERISDGFMALDLNWRFTYVNKKAEQIFKRPPGYLLGKHIWTEFPETINGSFYKASHKAMATQENSYIKEYSVLFDKWIEANTYTSLSGISIYFRDITEQKKAEDDVITEKQLSDSIINNLPGIFYLYDENGKYLRWNKTFEIVTGYSGEEIKKMHPLDFYDTDQHELIRKRIKTVFKKKVPGIEAVLLTKEKRKVPFFLNSQSVNYEGRLCLMGIDIDISEQKKTEEKIKLSHERYEAVAKATSDAIWDYDFASGKTYIAGAGYKEPFGYNMVNQYSEEFFWESRLHPDDKERVLAELNQVIGDPGRSQSASEYRLLKADGSYAYVYDRFFIIRENGKPVRMLGAKQDITIRKKAEEETRRSNERFETISRATNDALWDWNLLTDQVWWNESFYNILGFDSKLPVPELREWTKKVHPDDIEKVIVKLKSVKNDLIASWEDEFRFQLPDGHYGTALNRAYLLRDDSGNPVRVIGALMDITEQKRLVSELEVLSMIAKETSNGVLIFDKESRHTLWVNEGLTRLTGYTQQDMYGKDPASVLYGPDTDQHTLQYISSQKAKGQPYSADILVYTKDGEKKWHYISGQPMPEKNGQAANYFVLYTDISDRLRIEQERLTNKVKQQKEISRAILQAQEAERNELGRELHDNINQILSAISMKLDFCIADYNTSKLIVESCRQNIQEAIKEARNLSHRMVMPRFSESTLQNSLQFLVTNYSIQTVELNADKMKEKEIPASVKATLFRIVQEQLSNIQKHAKADKVRIELNNDAGQVTLLIEDNGVGFNTTQKRKGIGITNILNRVESYNGTADIISAPGKGCTLLVNIPLAGLV
jgi:PAS domain S-box-containing protein